MLEQVKNSVVQDIKLVDSKGFHMKITDSSNITVTNVNINAPGDSPNTDGVHISDSQDIFIINSVIGTGDDCVSIGDGNTHITVSNITCGPGHGIRLVLNKSITFEHCFSFFINIYQQFTFFLNFLQYWKFGKAS